MKKFNFVVTRPIKSSSRFEKGQVLARVSVEIETHNVFMKHQLEDMEDADPSHKDIVDMPDSKINFEKNSLLIVLKEELGCLFETNVVVRAKEVPESSL